MLILLNSAPSNFLPNSASSSYTIVFLVLIGHSLFVSILLEFSSCSGLLLLSSYTFSNAHQSIKIGTPRSLAIVSTVQISWLEVNYLIVWWILSLLVWLCGWFNRWRWEFRQRLSCRAYSFWVVCKYPVLPSSHYRISILTLYLTELVLLASSKLAKSSAPSLMLTCTLNFSIPFGQSSSKHAASYAVALPYTNPCSPALSYFLSSGLMAVKYSAGPELLKIPKTLNPSISAQWRVRSSGFSLTNRGRRFECLLLYVSSFCIYLWPTAYKICFFIAN